MRVTVIGTGYVGTVTGACLSYLGHHVTCVDTDEAKIAKLQAGRIAHLRAASAGDYLNWRPSAAASISAPMSAPRRPRATSFSSPWARRRCPAAKPIWSIWKPPRAVSARPWMASRFRVVVNKSTVPVGAAIWWRRWCAKASDRDAIRRAPPRDSLRRSQQSGIPARRQRGRRFALPGPHRGGRVR